MKGLHKREGVAYAWIDWTGVKGQHRGKVELRHKPGRRAYALINGIKWLGYTGVKGRHKHKQSA